MFRGREGRASISSCVRQIPLHAQLLQMRDIVKNADWHAGTLPPESEPDATPAVRGLGGEAGSCAEVVQERKSVSVCAILLPHFPPHSAEGAFSFRAACFWSKRPWVSPVAATAVTGERNALSARQRVTARVGVMSLAATAASPRQGRPGWKISCCGAVGILNLMPLSDLMELPPFQPGGGWSHSHISAN